VRRVGLAAIAVLASLTGSCTAIPAGDGPRRVVVRELGEQVIVPTYEELAVRAGALHTAVGALVEAPDATRLAEAQAAWRAAREPWMESQAFRIGPVKDQILDAAIDQWPVEAADLAEELARVEPIDAAYVDALGANRKGFHALEHLLFAADAATTLAGEPRRRDYVRELAADLDQRCAGLRDAWLDGGYLVRFVDVGSDDAAYATIKAAIDGVVNESVFLSEQITDAKLGKPLGHDAGGVPQPALQESGASDNSLADMTSNLRGLRHVWEGAGSGLRSLIAARSPSTAVRIDGELDAADAAVAAVPRPYATALVESGAQVEAAWAAVRELRLSIAIDVVAILGATLSFNDNDGD